MTKKQNPEKEISELLKDWCASLVRLQISMPGNKELDGAILCPACKTIHGRCHEAVYPLLYTAQKTGNDAYLTAAKKLFDWGENMRCPDGGMRNDAKSEWKGVTAFASVSLHDALYYHGALLSETEKTLWENRLRDMGEWLYKNLRPETPAYINYYAANACAMALLGNCFDRADYLTLAQEEAAYCFRHVSENGLVYGEGRPNDAKTEKGCFAIDPGGYNAEETLPCLYRYASAIGDNAAMADCKKLFVAQIEWMLPDGAWDNSVGTRAFKWTYWGSRTTDGSQEALFSLGREDPVFAEAALRNAQLLKRCTHNGLLYGGPDYALNGEPACVHHTFCHAKALAGALNAGLYAFSRTALPADDPVTLKRYPENDTLRLAVGGWRADITGYDFSYMKGDHASGGALSLLWHEKTGPLIAAGAVDPVLKEPHNQQLSVRQTEQRCTCPRIETLYDGVRFGQHYDFGAVISAEETDDRVTVSVKALLCDENHRSLPENGACTLRYELTAQALTVSGGVSPALARQARFVLPLIGNGATVKILSGSMPENPLPFFNLNPGFAGLAYTVLPDETGRFSLRIVVK